jgi:uncharacterized FlgJ-related protein
MKTILIILFLLIGIKTDYAKVEIINVELVNVEETALSIEDSIRLILNEKNLPKFTVDLIVAQSKHESGNYTNKLTKLHNNIFGRHYSKYDTLALGDGGEAEGHTRFARYKSIADATNSQYKYFLRKKYSLDWYNVDDFVKELKSKNYFEDKTDNYKKSINKLLN